MLQQAQQAEQRLAELRDTLVGELRIATPVGIGGRSLAEALAPLLQAHPKLTLRVLADDRIVDMIEQRVDIALRANRQLADANMIAHPLTAWPMVLCAAPRYLSQHGVPEKPQDLVQHRWISSGYSGAHLDLLHQSGQQVKLRLAEGQIVSESMNVMRAFTRAGLGISIQPLYEIGDELQRGELLLLLPEWRPAPLRLHALTLERNVPEKSRQALRYLRDYFRRNGERDLPAAAMASSISKRTQEAPWRSSLNFSTSPARVVAFAGRRSRILPWLPAQPRGTLRLDEHERRAEARGAAPLPSTLPAPATRQ